MYVCFPSKKPNIAFCIKKIGATIRHFSENLLNIFFVILDINFINL